MIRKFYMGDKEDLFGSLSILLEYCLTRRGHGWDRKSAAEDWDRVIKIGH